jgi:hypothetical protein
LTAAAGWGHAAGRRAALVALGLLGTPDLARHPHVRLTDPLDTEAVILAIVCSALMPPMGGEVAAFDQNGREVVRPEEMVAQVRVLEGRLREATAVDVTTASLQAAMASGRKIRTGRWFEVID